MKFAIALTFSAGAFAQIGQPRIGVMLNRDTSARPLLGIPGTNTLGAAAADGVISMACAPIQMNANSGLQLADSGMPNGNSACLMKTDSAILSPTGSAPAPPGPALFSFAGDSVLVYFSRTRRFATWANNQLTPADFRIAGEILSIGNDSFVVRRPGGVWVVNGNDQPTASLPIDITAALPLDSGVVFANAGQLTIQRSDQSQQSFAIEGTISLSWLSPNYIQVRTHDSSYALRVDNGHERVFLLPEP